MAENVRATSLAELFNLLGVTKDGVAAAERERDDYIAEWQLQYLQKQTKSDRSAL